MATSTSTVSTSDYIQSLGARVNSVWSEIDQNTNKLNNLADEQQIYQDQLDRVAKILTYLKKVSPQVADLKESVTSLLRFFSVDTPSHLSPAQKDLKPADDSLKTISEMVSQIGSRLYFSILNTNVCAVAIEDTYNMLIKNTKHDPAPDPSSGKVNVDLGPSEDLVSKLKAGTDAGIAALESLANTFLEYISYLNAIEELRGTANYLTTGFSDEITALKTLESRFDNRSRIANAENKEYEKDYKKVNAEYKRLADYLTQLQLDYNLLRAEFDAALASTAPGTPVPQVK